MNEEEFKELLRLRKSLGLYNKMSVQDLADRVCHISVYDDGYFFYILNEHGHFVFDGTVPEEEFSEHILFPVEIV